MSFVHVFLYNQKLFPCMKTFIFWSQISNNPFEPIVSICIYIFEEKNNFFSLLIIDDGLLIFLNHTSSSSYICQGFPGSIIFRRIYYNQQQPNIIPPQKCSDKRKNTNSSPMDASEIIIFDLATCKVKEAMPFWIPLFISPMRFVLYIF